MAAVGKHDAVLPMAEDSDTLQQLDAVLGGASESAVYVLGPDGERLELPAPMVRLLARMVHHLAQGRGVSLAVVDAELTTQQAADLLNVSRPFLVKLLETGEIPFLRVGTHRRVRCADVLAYRQNRSQQRRAMLTELAREAQELGIYE